MRVNCLHTHSATLSLKLLNRGAPGTREIESSQLELVGPLLLDVVVIQAQVLSRSLVLSKYPRKPRVFDRWIATPASGSTRAQESNR